MARVVLPPRDCFMRRAMLWYATALHLWWIVALALSPSALGVTGVAALSLWFGGRWGVFAALVVCTGMALCGLVLSLPKAARLCLLLGQQLLLVLSAIGATLAMINLSYADGVPRPFWFISSDQIHYVVAAGMHVVAVIDEGDNPC